MAHGSMNSRQWKKLTHVARKLLSAELTSPTKPATRQPKARNADGETKNKRKPLRKWVWDAIVAAGVFAGLLAFAFQFRPLVSVEAIAPLRYFLPAGSGSGFPAPPDTPSTTFRVKNSTPYNLYGVIGSCRCSWFLFDQPTPESIQRLRDILDKNGKNDGLSNGFSPRYETLTSDGSFTFQCTIPVMRRQKDIAQIRAAAALVWVSYTVLGIHRRQFFKFITENNESGQLEWRLTP